MQEPFFGAIDSRRPEIAEDAFIAPATVVVGRVRESDTAMVGHAFESYVRKSGVHREVEPLSLWEVLPR